MQIIQERSSVTTNLKSKEFRISNSAFMFSTLIKKLYSDPITAILRELGANAYDAHIEANQSKPFDIKLPTISDSEFYIRDYGLGMSPQKIDEIYTEIGASDKRINNNSIGGFGLGSKTPFSIVDSFIVESFHNGKHYIYSMHMNDANVPSYSLISELDSKEPSGLKISLDTNQDKNNSGCWAWEVKTQEVFKYFKKLPNFIGKQVKFSTIVPLLSDKNWTLHTNYTFHAVMGQIPYTVNSSVINMIDKKLSYLFQYGFVLYFDIGELSVTPSRETLELNKRTLLYLEKRLHEIHDNINNTVVKEINLCPNRWLAILKAKELCKNTLFSKLNKFEYNNVDITDQLKGIDVSKFEVKDFSKVSIIYPSEVIKFYENDVSYAYSRVREHSSGYIVNFKDAQEKKDFCEYMGFDESYILSASSLPAHTAKTRSKTFKFSKFNGNKYNNNWEEENVDITKGGVYICTYRYSGYYNDKKINNSDIKILLSYCNSYNKIDNLYGVKKAHEKILLKKKNWTNLIDLTSKYFAKDVKDKIIYSSESLYILKQSISYNFQKHLSSNHPIIDTYNKLLKFRFDDIYSKIRLLNTIKKIIDSPLDIDLEDCIPDLKKKLSKYPLIDFSSGYSDCDFKHIIAYMEAIDNNLI